MVVMDWHFGALKSCRMNLPNHFNANHTTVLFERDLIENRSPYESEVAINVSKREAKQHFDGVMVYATDDDAVKRI
tara:strand:+ start:202 stop:429 length:228 start_codon:yes stop_codon:yes gene_type:complete